MTPADLLERLGRWRAAGWLRALDMAFARFVHELDREAPASLVLAAALLAQLEGRGHSCLPLGEMARNPLGVLGWPEPAESELAGAFADWPADATAAQAAWGGRTVLQFESADAAGSSPLVLSGDRLYLRRYWRYESRVAAQVRARAQANGAAVDAIARLNRDQARVWLDRLFAPSGASAAAEVEPAGTDWQKVAGALALRGRLTLITGGPGTGKTYTAARLLVLLQALHAAPQPLRVALAAPTGKAAARLRQSIDTALQGLRAQLGAASPFDAWAAQLGPARTLHSLLGARPGTRRFRHDAAHPLDLDLLFVDEASMIHLEMMAALLDALPSTARLILLGDKDQLASVEAGAVMGDLCQAGAREEPAHGYGSETLQWVHELTGQALPASEADFGPDLAQQTVTLRHSRRFSGPIGQLALAVNRGDGAAALAVLREPGGQDLALIEARDAGVIRTLAVEGRTGAGGGYRAYLEALALRPTEASGFDAWARALLRQFDRFRVLCAVRDGPWGVAGLNPAIERALMNRGLLQRRSDWYEGRPVMVTRNDAALGVFNGDIGVALGAPGGTEQLRVYFLDGSELRSVSAGRLADVETAFAMTVHKSQGSEFEHVVLVLPNEDSPVLTRELVYTGITRAQRAFTLVASDPGQLATASLRRTRRLSGLRARLDR
ncbi:MAG: exodeoxyribonuclease V subunit alpha [Burkholderiaceae bacterium]